MRASSSTWSRGRVAAPIATMALLALAALGAGTASAAPPVAWQTQAGVLGTGRGIAADPASGAIYVSDQAGRRVVKLNAWGQFLRTWGWDVVASGPGDTAEGKFEICVPSEGDVCKTGAPGSGGTGQLTAFGAGVAVDSAGDVYAAEIQGARRVQKFSPDGEFLLSFGGGVNQGGGSPESPGDVCTKEHIENGDTCGAGANGTGPGEFSASGSLRNVIAIDSDDDVWVGDKERVQRFDTGGAYQGEVKGDIGADTVHSLAVDSEGFLYASYDLSTNTAKPNVRKLDPTSGEELLSFAVPDPAASAPVRDPGSDEDGDLYAFDGAGAQIHRFDPAATPIEAPFGEGLNAGSNGLATSTACGVEGHVLYHSDTSGFVRSYGSLPNPDLCPPAEEAPEITEQYARSVGIAEATVGADIDPLFWRDTTYYVQYGTAACLAADDWNAPCVQATLLPGAGLTEEAVSEPLPASAILSGLAPDTEYAFRFVAQSSGGEAQGPKETFTTFPPNPPAATGCENQPFRTGPSALLPDCRAYEMVSPVEKNNGDIRAGLNISSEEQIYPKSTPGGGKLTYSSGTSFAGADGAPFASQYIASRGGEGWASEAISPARERNISGTSERFLNNQFLAFSDDLCTAWLFWDGDPPLGDPPVPGIEGFRKLYERDNCDPGAGSYFPLVRSAPPTAPEGANPNDFDPVLLGLSADGSHAVYRANDALAVDEGPAPKAGTPGAGSNEQLYEVYDGGKVRLVSVLPGEPGVASGQENTLGDAQVSPSTDQDYGSGNAANAVSDDGETIFWSAQGILTTLYARLGGAETIEVASGPSGSFQAAAADGSAVLFKEGSKLQRFDVASETTTTIAAANFLGLVGASENLSHIYYTTNTAGKRELMLHEGAASSPVATLADNEGNPATRGSITESILISRPSRVSPDGAHAVFISRAPLTGYDNRDTITGEPDTEVFLYSADEDQLLCVSCNPTGARPLGTSKGVLGRGLGSQNSSGLIPGHKGHFHSSRVLSADGERLFFESFDRLLPRDTNGNRDVYQWQAPGKGECTSSHPHYFDSNGGCLALISTGKGDGDADFIEATPSGNDVFFRTEQSLVDQDPGLVDIYDARVNGGFASPAPSQASCEGDACQAPARTPEFPVPGSSSFQGPVGLPGPGPCARHARRARRISNTAKRARRAARRAQGKRATRRMARLAKGKAKRARRSSRQAKRCRAARKANTSGRALR